MRNPVTARPWGKHDAAILKAAGYISPDWATATQWARAGETIAAAEPATMVAFTRGADRPAPGARLYAVYNRVQLESAQASHRCEPAILTHDGSPRLVTFLVRMGGLRDTGGDLRAMDAHKQRIGLVRKSGGVQLDLAARAAEEAGYLPAGTFEGGCINALLDAISDDLRGRPVYPYAHAAGSGCPF